MSALFAFLVAFQATSGSTAVAKAEPWDVVPLRVVSQIELPANVLQGAWKASTGLRIDELSKTEQLPPEYKRIVEALAKQFAPIGVRSVADYSLVKTDVPLNTVTVRVFVFNDANACRSWWQKKYERERWQKHYKKVDCNAAVVVSSLEMNKTAMAFGNVWLTTHQLGEGNEHIAAANHVLKQLTAGKRRLPEP